MRCPDSRVGEVGPCDTHIGGVQLLDIRIGQLRPYTQVQELRLLLQQVEMRPPHTVTGEVNFLTSR